MRTPRADRATRRALNADTLTGEAVKRLQGQRIAKWAKDDRKAVAVQAERIGNVRTLRNDEQAKSRTPSQGAVMAGAAIWNEHTTIEEHRDDYLIPRESLTSRLCLRLFKPVMQFRDEPFKILSQESRNTLAELAKDIRRCHPDNRAVYAEKRMEAITPTLTYVTGTNPRLAWKSDETLLNTRKGYDNLEHIAFKRVTSQTKGTRIEKESADVSDVLADTDTLQTR